MLLQQLKLNNIRSYHSQEINFPEGATLLAGDIGAGKSSLLLAIEFALFGTSRPDLPAEFLLRKGETQGSVELTFLLGQQQIAIKRNLKKDQNGIKQTAGYLIINGLKKELTAVELKAEIVHLLGYPEEFIDKNKNYLFRYTVYTPQEEMKQILNENAEDRLDVLRKIFNIDKYKMIRDNLQIYLKEKRMEIAVLKTKTEPLQELEEEQKRKNEEADHLQKLSQELKPKREELLEALNCKARELEQLETEQKELDNLRQEQKTKTAIYVEKKQQALLLKQKKERITEMITSLALPVESNLELIKTELQAIEKQKKELLTRKTELSERIKQLQKIINEKIAEINQIENEVNRIPEKEKLQEKLRLDVNSKEKIKLALKEIEKGLEEGEKLLVKQKLILEEAEEKQKIMDLENCPTCLQKVSAEHKERIKSEQEDKIRAVKPILGTLELRKKWQQEEKEKNSKLIEEINQKEMLLARIKMELQQLKERSNSLVEKKSLLRLLVQENNHCQKEASILETEQKITQLEQEEKEKRERCNLILQKEYLEKQKTDFSAQEEQNENSCQQLSLVLDHLAHDLAKRKDYLEEIKQKKKEWAEISFQEKTIAIEEAKAQTALNSILRIEEQLQKNIADLREKRKTLEDLKKTYFWLEEFFLKLTYTIEKQVMTNIHHLFNELFQEWFSILIEDENVTAKIDDSFTPVIEQNGYEVSFFNLSGGEKTSASLAYRLALNRVINDVIHEIKTKNLLILDEPTDGFSSEQLDKMRDILDKLQLRQTIIVSHETTIESFVENVLHINKNNHVSVLSQE